MTVAQARHRGAAAGVEIAAAALVDQIGSFTADRGRITLAQRPMQHVACCAALESVVHGVPLARAHRLRAPRSASRWEVPPRDPSVAILNTIEQVGKVGGWNRASATKSARFRSAANQVIVID